MIPISPHPVFPEIKLLSLTHFEDERGSMSRIFDKDLFREYGISSDFVQTSHSHTKTAGVLRGIFVSLPPYQEAKIVRILRGQMQWVLVDVRPESSSFGQWTDVMLDGAKRNGFYAPQGFAHACLCLENSTDLILMANHPFLPGHSTGIRWDDPDLNIQWRTENNLSLQVSKAHLEYPNFKNLIAEKLKS